MGKRTAQKDTIIDTTSDSQVNSNFPYRWLRDPGRGISFPIFIRKEIETRKLERKSKQKISRLIDLLYRLNDIISR